MDPLGLTHVGSAVAALFLGPAVFFRRKGDGPHRRLGYAYVGSMLLLNVTALSIYDFTGRWGLFHWFAAASLLTVVGGFVPVFLRRPAGTWLDWHYAFMCWSYVGLSAAAVSEALTRVPQLWPAVGAVLPESYFWIVLNVSLTLCMAIGAYTISFRRMGYTKDRGALPA
jgi:uncharacterized membrane protein